MNENQEIITPTSVNEWRKKSTVGKVFTIELPSGNVAKVTRPGLEMLISGGVMPDSLLQIAQGAVEKGAGKRVKIQHLDDDKARDIAENPELWSEMIDSVDQIVSHVFVDPKVKYAKEKTTEKRPNGKTVVTLIPLDKRDPNYLYTDELELDDKFFVFSFISGDSADLKSFRDKLRGNVESISDGSEVSPVAESDNSDNGSD